MLAVGIAEVDIEPQALCSANPCEVTGPMADTSDKNRIGVLSPFSSDLRVLDRALLGAGFVVDHLGAAVRVEALLDADYDLPSALLVDSQHLSERELMAFLDDLFRYCLAGEVPVPLILLVVNSARTRPVLINRLLNARIDRLFDRELDPGDLARFLERELSGTEGAEMAGASNEGCWRVGG